MRLRVLKIVTRLVRGGAQGTCLAVARELTRRGHFVTVAYGPADGSEGDYEPELARMNLPGRRIGALVRDPAPAKDLAALVALVGEIRRNGYDVVHTYTSKAGFLGRLAASLTGAPAVIHSAQGHIFAAGARIPGVSGWALRVRIFKWMETAAARWTDRMIALTPAEVADQARLGIAPPDRFAVIPNPVEDRLFEPVEPLPREPGTFVMVVVARLASEKGHAFLFAAFRRLWARLPSARLWVVGDGPDASSVRKEAASLGIDPATRFLGFQEDVRPFLHGADLLVLPSSYEAQGIVILEAFACERAVVATDVGGVRQFVRDGENGLLVPFGDEERMSQALFDLASDAPRRKRLAAAGARGVQRYRVGAIAADVEKLYYEVLREKHAIPKKRRTGFGRGF